MIKSSKNYIYSLFLKFFLIGIFIFTFFHFYLYELSSVIHPKFLDYLKNSFWILVVIYIIIIFIYPFLANKNNEINIDKLHTRVKKGVFILKEEYILNSKIQFIEINKDPFDLIFKIHSLVIFTSGTNISINGLNQKDALYIKDLLEEIIGEKNETI